MQPSKQLRAKLGDWARDLMPSCRDVARLQSRALDESLPLRARLGLGFHVLYCIWCRRYGRQLRFLRAALQDNTDRLVEGFARTLPPEAGRRIKERLRKEAD